VCLHNRSTPGVTAIVGLLVIGFASYCIEEAWPLVVVVSITASFGAFAIVYVKEKSDPHESGDEPSGSGEVGTAQPSD
jgi:hypothetical protein